MRPPPSMNELQLLVNELNELAPYLNEGELAEIEMQIAAIQYQLEEEEIDDEAVACRAKLSTFFRRSWHVLEPTTPLADNWHLDVICDHVQAVLEDWMAHQCWLMRREKRRKELDPHGLGNSIISNSSAVYSPAAQSLFVRLKEVRSDFANPQTPIAQMPPAQSPPAQMPPLAEHLSEHFHDPEPVQRIQNLLINVPPGTAKSRIVGVCAPAWMWLHWPSWRALFLSANPDIALRDSTFCRDLIESEWYQSRFKPTWKLRNDKNAVSDYWNTAGGQRRAKGWFAKITGSRNDALFVDDPHDADSRNLSDQNLATVNDRWDNAIRNRISDPRFSVRIGIMQRLAQNDWSGHALATGIWHLVCVPQEFEPQRLKDDPDYKKGEYPRVSKTGWRDPRTKLGELLFPQRFTPEFVEEEKAVGSFYYAGQHQQRPAPAEGGIWKRFWWGFWVPSGITLPRVSMQLADGTMYEHSQCTLPARFEFQLQSWDMAFGKSETSSMVVGQVWALQGVDRFLLDQLREQMDFTETQSAFRQLSGDWPQVETKLVENKANGPAIISSLKGEFSGIIAVEPEGDKVARAMAEQGTLESGHVWLPHPVLFDAAVLAQLETRHPQLYKVLQRSVRQRLTRLGNKPKAGRAGGKTSNWVEEYVEESASFPNGAFKDVVDTASQALLRMRKYIAQRDRSTGHKPSTGWRSMS